MRPEPGVLERRSGVGGELGRDPSLELELELGRLVEVVGADLDELVGDGAACEPGRQLPVQQCAGGLRQARVGDVADQDVLEPVRLLPRIVERCSRTRKSRCTSSSRWPSAPGLSVIALTAPDQNVRPATAARRRTAF